MVEPILFQYLPKILQSDNGGKFTSAKALEMYKELGIKHLSSFPHKPSTKGMIECFNQTIKHAIMQYMMAQGTNRWYDVIDTITTTLIIAQSKPSQRISSFLVVWALAKLPRTISIVLVPP